MSDCQRITLYKRNMTDEKGAIVRVRCGLWTCVHCSEINKRRVIARAINGSQGHEQWFLVTITSHADMRGFDKSLKCLRSGWGKLYANMKKAIKEYNLGSEFLYLKVYEKHKDGSLHVHLLTNINWQSSVKRQASTDKRKRSKLYTFLPDYKVKRKDHTVYYRSAWLADYASKAGLGYVNECRPLQGYKGQTSNMGAIAYVAKYLNKQGNNHLYYPKGFHRVEFSQSWPQLPPLESDGNVFVQFTWATVFDDLISGWDVTDETKKGLVNLIWSWGLARFGRHPNP